MSPSADIVVGLGWGDEGKGATVDALVAHSKADRVVRFNGGQQAAHNVIANGVHHTFSSYGSGTMSGVPTWVSSYCTINPINIFNEKSALIKKGFNPVLNVDENAKVTTALHVLANVIREEARGDNNHGTTGTGFGETIDFSLRHPDLAITAEDLWLGFTPVYKKLLALRDYYVDEEELMIKGHANLQDTKMQSLAGVMVTMGKHFNIVTTDDLVQQMRHGHTVFEGAQGFILDENFGFNPYTTWSTTTPSNARQLCVQAGIEPRAVGVLRSYATRHGAGPLPHEGELGFEPDEPHNTTESSMAGVFRTAPHDVENIQWAIDTTMVDVLSVTHLDVFNGFQTDSGLFPLDTFKTPVIMEAYGPRREDRKIHTVYEV